MLVKTSVKQNTQNALLPNTREKIVLRFVPLPLPSLVLTRSLTRSCHIGCEYYDILIHSGSRCVHFHESNVSVWLCVGACVYVCLYVCIFPNLEPLTDLLTPTTPCTCTLWLCVYVMAILEKDPLCVCLCCASSHVFCKWSYSKSIYIHISTFVHLCAHLYKLTLAHRHTRSLTSQTRIQTTQNNQYIFDVKRENESFMNLIFFVVFVVVAVVVGSSASSSSTILLLHMSLSCFHSNIHYIRFIFIPIAKSQCWVDSSTNFVLVYARVYKRKLCSSSHHFLECKPLETVLRIVCVNVYHRMHET